MADSYEIKRFSDFVSERARFHPANCQQIAERFKQAIPDAIMAGSRKPRVRRDGNFDYPQPFHFDQGGKEPVRAIEKLHVCDAFALKRTIRATGITDGFAGELVAHPVGNP